MPKQKIIVIGGGAAGLMAAGQAAEGGTHTLVLEKMKRPGRKLCITGKGRCNITNMAAPADFISHFGRTGNFLRQAFSRFSNTDLMDFLEALGLELVTERGGRVFPASGKASDVLRVLLTWLKRCGVQIKPASVVDGLLMGNGRVTGVMSRGRKFPCDAVILTTGGASYPATGSTGDGYRLGKSAGHKVVPIRPALVPMETSGEVAGKMAGLHLRNVKVRMLVNGKKRREGFGEVVFTEFGVTGPVILTLSGDAVDALREGHQIVFSLDLKPALDEKKLDGRLLRDFASRSKEPFHSLLRGLLPYEMVPVCLDGTGIAPERRATNITAKERRSLRRWLKDFRLEVSRPRPLSEAIVTAGGIDTREVDPRTMASRQTGGLFLAGEILDIQADTGGYNLQAAFSTGWLAGRSAAAAR
ncbi:MAG: NAD(P)/FAD-dependent oxidoreductase [Thermodesulfobacteriota bacterium]|nr:NAD(P)/FAD-dependent oxidoreductase [Thermodesulfobacteriota bacterium]